MDLVDLLADLPQGARLTHIGQTGRPAKEVGITTPEGTWQCTLSSLGSAPALPCYAWGSGPSPAIAFARAKQQWLAAIERESSKNERAPRNYPRRSVTGLSLDDLDL